MTDRPTPTCSTGVGGRAGFVVAELRDLLAERRAARAVRSTRRARTTKETR